MLIPFAEAYTAWLDNPEKAQGWVDRLSKREVNLTNSGLCTAYGGYMAYRRLQGDCELGGGRCLTRFSVSFTGTLAGLGLSQHPEKSGMRGGGATRT